MARAQSSTKLRVWLFKSFVTAGNDVLEKQVQTWAKDRKVTVETDWATFSDREQKFVTGIEAGNPPDIAEMNINGPMRYKAALKDVTKVASDIPAARGGMLPFGDRAMNFDGKYYGVPRYSMTTVFYIRKDLMEAKGLKPPPSTIQAWWISPRRLRIRPRTSSASGRRSTGPTTATASWETSSGTTAGACGIRTASPSLPPRSTTRISRRSSSPSIPSPSTRSSRRA